MADIFHKKGKFLVCRGKGFRLLGSPLPKIGAKIHFRGSLQTLREGKEKVEKILNARLGINSWAAFAEQPKSKASELIINYWRWFFPHSHAGSIADLNLLSA